MTPLNHMRKAGQFMFGSGCLVSVLAPIIGLLLYPRAKWLFAFVLVGIALILLNIFASAPGVWGCGSFAVLSFHPVKRGGVIRIEGILLHLYPGDMGRAGDAR